MASIYFNNVDFYRGLVSQSLSGGDASQTVATTNDATDTTICARIRPLSNEEEESHQITGIVAKGPSRAVLFEPRTKFNGTPDANKYEFSLDHVYDVDVQTENIYQEAAQDLVPWMWAGGVGTLFAYGQTGSGKTFTVTGITELIVKDIMAMAGISHRELYICCFEILGKKAYDLLDNRRVFSVMEDSFGVTQLVGVQEQHPASEQEFLTIIRTSSLLRTSAPTSKNDQSSRSHAVHRIRVVNKSDTEQPDGELFLVDLAGSEGSQDSMNHSADRINETKDINASLSILKDCIRGRTLWGVQQMQHSPIKGSIHIPWRSSKLTQVLKHVFETRGERSCKTVVVACVAPSIVDSAHSKNTLRYADMLKVPVPKMKKQKDMKNPSGWTNELVKQWITENSGTPSIDANILAARLNGTQLCKLSQKEFISRCLQTTGVGQDQATAFYQKLWRLHIDSRQRSSTFAAEKVEVQQPLNKPDGMPFKSRIKPGMFVRLKSEVSKLEGGNIAMILSPSRPEDFDNKGEERRFICAPVGPSIMAGAYELFVATQETYNVQDMANEVLMEYDFATRYYYMDL